MANSPTISSPHRTIAGQVGTSSPLRKSPLLNGDSWITSSEHDRRTPKGLSHLGNQDKGPVKRVGSTVTPSRLATQHTYSTTLPERDKGHATARAALKPIAQGANSPTHRESPTSNHAKTHLGSPVSAHSSPPTSNVQPRPRSLVISRADSVRTKPIGRPNDSSPQHTHFASQPNLLDRPHLQELQKSTTGHLRTLSKYAENNVPEELSVTSREQEVVGLFGRRRLQCDQPTGTTTNKAAPPARGTYQHTKWMDQQRQFLQAYEYLCHIGEAKEWIEDIIHKQIPPIVELEESLRDGVVLAEIIQSLYPARALRIFRNEKLQFRHSDNIALFFRFLAEVELPELFRFELVDLYEKKNIPKVIYCIHALSWLLFRQGIVDFRIGNLVGQLEFEDHELEKTQQGLDKAGVSMPNFKGMSASFDVEPVQAPVESESDRIARELSIAEGCTIELQAQIRGATIRNNLGETMQALWDSEDSLVRLQSIARAGFARQVANYRSDMKRFAVLLQSAARGNLARIHWRQARQEWKQSTEVIALQAQIRGALQQWSVGDQYYAAQEAEGELPLLQGAIRGALMRRRQKSEMLALQRTSTSIASLQAIARTMQAKTRLQATIRAATMTSPLWSRLQARLRGDKLRRSLAQDQQHLAAQANSIARIQAKIRGHSLRTKHVEDRNTLLSHSSSINQLQDRIRGTAERQRMISDRHCLEQNEVAIVELQAMARAFVQREQTFELLLETRDHEASIVDFQSAAAGVLCRQRIGVLLAALEAEEHSVTAAQTMLRGHLVRRAFEVRRQHYNENMAKVIKVQSLVRSRQQGEAYKSLTTGSNPPVATVKNFVHLLNDSDFDFDEEFEFERLRKTVTQNVRQNEMAEQYIDQLDIKIALLVKNKITLDEVLRHQKQFGGHIGGLLDERKSISKDQFDLKALNKNSRKKLEHYQELFYVLQTQPQYLARLFRSFRGQGQADKETKKMEILMLGVFGFAQKRREEYYLLKVIACAIQEECEACPSLFDYLRSSFFWNKLLSAYLRSPRDRRYMKQLFGPLVRESIFEQEGLDLESDPKQIYRAAINNEELRTGQRSQRNPDVAREEAIRDPETRQAFVAHLQDLRDIADQFFALLSDTLPQMPFGVRYVAQQQFETLKHKYPQEDEQHLLQCVGQWLWKSYLAPALSQPEMFGVIDRGLSPIQKRNLGEVARAVGQVFSGKLFGGENVYLQPLNQWVSESLERLSTLLLELVNIRPAVRQFGIEEFNDMYSRTKPTLYIKMSDILAVHHLLAADPLSICPARDDVMREILRELGSAKSSEDEMASMSSQEISLQLTGRFHDVQDVDADIKSLFMETKRLVLYIIRIQAGASLLEILVKPITGDDEARWQSLLDEEARNRQGERRHDAYAGMDGDAAPTTRIDVSGMHYAEVKSAALENILLLEQHGQVHRSNQYQAILNAIAIDIRTKHRRRVERARELDGVRATLMQLESKAEYLEEQLQSYNDYVEQAMNTLQNKRGKKRFLLPFTKQYNHEKELAKSGRTPKFGSFKYSARSLADKGVLVSWAGHAEEKWSRINLTISSDQVGVFHIEGSSGSMMIPGASVSVPMYDLLQAQFENVQYIDLFSDKSLRLNVNLLLNLVYRKFFSSNEKAEG